ncbi:MAG: SDR family NAD(P)-dependent oxidoreductase [Chloroflexi bacterium]|nr:SDR family NAD(P)-dependent oxidoreductase [Chloroflexota bacterium]
MGKLDNRVAIVTGAGRGIGAETAKLLGAEGARVVVNDLGSSLEGGGRDTSPADEVVASINDAGGQAVANYDDVTSYDAAEDIIRTALDTYGDLDILINVAGNLRDKMVFNMTEEEWDSVVDVHMKGTFTTTKYASIHWRTERKGHYRLINFTSGSGLHGAAGQPNYAAAKLGIVGFTYSCANALERYGVTSNCIAPGASTRMTDSVPGDRRRSSSAMATEVSPDHPRWPGHVSKPIIYIASEESDWLNGRVIRAMGYRIGFYSNPTLVKELVREGGWELDDVFAAFENEFKPIAEGRDGLGFGGQ